MLRDLIINGQIHLYGIVGASEGEEGFTTTDVAHALAEIGPGDVTARINSGGGIAYDGMTIYSQFASHPGKVTMIVDGVAASAGSLLAMAGDAIEMRDGAMMMIHDPAGLSFGPAKAHADAAAMLDKLADNYAAVYAARSGKEAAEVRKLMLATTWLTADEAVTAKFATAKIEAKSLPVAKFDYSRYPVVPEAVRSAMIAPPAPALDHSASRARMRMRELGR